MRQLTTELFGGRGHSRTSQKKFGGDEVLHKFYHICPNHERFSSRLLYKYDKTLFRKSLRFHEFRPQKKGRNCSLKGVL